MGVSVDKTTLVHKTKLRILLPRSVHKAKNSTTLVAMGSNEKFCLRWNDFESNISVAFREIREEKDFFDCTISCGARQIQAHKLILSACSPFFRSILRQNPHQHPLLYLKGVEFTDLQSVLNFMYHGEVNVAQEELNSFLSVAEDLQVKGLTQNNAPTNSNPKPELPSPPVPRPRPPREPEAIPIPKRPRPVAAAPPPPSQPAYQSQEEDIQEIIPMPVVKTEPQPATFASPPALSTSVGYADESSMMDTMGTEVASMEESYGEEGYDDYGGYEGQGYEGGDGHVYAGQGYGGDGAAGQKGINSFVLRSETGYTCVECGKQFSDQSNCRRHIKEKHFGQDQDNCPVCNKIISKRNLQRHVKICIVQK